MASQQNENIYTLCEKLAKTLEELRDSRGYYHMDSMIRNSNNIGDFIEEIKLYSRIPLFLESEKQTDYQVVLSEMDETSDQSDDENVVPAPAPVVQEDDTEDEVTEDEVKEFKQILLERKRDRENYFRRTILVRNLMKTNDQDQNVSYFAKIFKNLKECSLEFLMMQCIKFYVLENGSVRFTFPNRREAIAWLIEARGAAQKLHRRWCALGRNNIQIQLMVPPDSVGLKFRIENYGKRLKMDKVIQSYQALETKQDGEWKMHLKIYLRGKGSFTIRGNELQDYDRVLQKTRSIVESQNGIGIDRLFQTEE